LELIPGAEHDQDKVLRPQLAIDFFRDMAGLNLQPANEP